MRMFNQNKNLVLSVVVGMSASSCTTLFSNNKSEEAKKPHGEIVLQRAGTDENQVAGKDKSYWIEVNNKSKKLGTKMVASLAAGDSESSETYARKVLRKKPGDVKALSILSASLAQSKNFSLAAFYAKELLKKDENNSLALNIVGLSYLMTTNATMKDFAIAKDYFEKSIQGSGKEIAAALNLAYLHLEVGRPDLAFDVFSTAHERCQGCFHSSIGRGIAATRIGRYDVAKEDFERILSQDDKNGEAMYRLALLKKNGYNDHNGAKDLLDKLLNESDGDSNLKRRAYVLARKLEDTKDRTVVAEDSLNSTPEKTDDMGELYKALDSE